MPLSRRAPLPLATDSAGSHATSNVLVPSNYYSPDDSVNEDDKVTLAMNYDPALGAVVCIVDFSPVTDALIPVFVAA